MPKILQTVIQEILNEDIVLTKTKNKIEIPYTIPGALQSLTVNGEVVMDNPSTDSKSTKVPKSYKEKSISLSLVIMEPYIGVLSIGQKSKVKVLKELEQVFYTKHNNTGEKDSKDAPATPVIYKISNSHINTRGIHHVIFSALSSSQSQDKDYYTVNITFEEVSSPSYTVEGIS